MSFKIEKNQWKQVRLDDIVEWYQKDIPNNKQILLDIENYITAEHIESDVIKITRSGLVKSGKKGPTITKHYQKGDLLLSTRSVALRKASITQNEGVTGEKLLVLRPKKNSELIVELFPFIFKSSHFWNFAQNSAAGSVNKFTSWTKIKEYQFLLPPKDQQAKIAKLLWAMDDVVEKEKVLLENLNISYLSEIEKVLLNKDGEIRKVSDLGEIIRGVGYKPGDLSDEYSDENCIILRANNIKDSDINYDDIKILSLSKVKKIQLLQQNDFAICMSNGSKELVGKTAKYNNESKNVSIGSFCSAFRANGSMETSIVQHFFASETYRQTIKRVLTGSNINNLKPIDIESIKFRINESESILSNSLIKLDKMKRTTFRIKKSIEDSKQLQKSLINEIFSV